MPERPPTTGAQVTIHACSGETAAARLAQDIASRLQKLDVGSTSGERVIAVDGCRSGCASRRLAAQGLEAESVSLETFGVQPGQAMDERERSELAGAIANHLASRSRLAHLPHRRPDPPSLGATGTALAHTVDDYLLTISLLTSPVVACGAVATDVPTLASHVARALGVSRPTAGEMLARIGGAGLIERGPSKTIVLTDEGRAGADRIVGRHRVVERFLADILGYGGGESRTLALTMRGSFPGDTVERLRSVVAPATTCPHGWPFEPGTGIEVAADLVALPALSAGTRRPIAALAEHDGVLLARLCDLGLGPGIEIEVIAEGVGPTIVAGGATLALDPHEAAAVLVLLSSE